jgi:hypothetical protein
MRFGLLLGSTIFLCGLGHSCGGVAQDTPRQSSGSGGIDSGGSSGGRGGAVGRAGAGGHAGANDDAAADSRADARDTAVDDAAADSHADAKDAAFDDDATCPPAVCSQIQCGQLNECGNCVDDDNDGLIDAADPGCLGPCDNQEQGLYSYPMHFGETCRYECYFDDNTGAGDDMCQWDLRCDPLSPSAECAFQSDAGRPDCERLAASQPASCIQQCMPRVPNGCDCFGCCELKPGSGRYVWLGRSSCEVDVADDPTKCPPCTPVTACLNTCEPCELCLGKPVLPPSCTEPSCSPGAEPCGPCRPCPSGKFCSLGCCI